MLLGRWTAEDVRPHLNIVEPPVFELASHEIVPSLTGLGSNLIWLPQDFRPFGKLRARSGYFCRPSESWFLIVSRLPTAGTVGCILSPLRGWRVISMLFVERKP
jgi:hypothetical protein